MKRKGSVDFGIFVIVLNLVMALGYVYMLSELVGSAGGAWRFDERAVTITVLFISVEVTLLILTPLMIFLVPHLTRRIAALRALGSNGFGKLALDPVARIVYRGIYCVLNGEDAKAEKYLEQAISNANSVDNQLFCYDWLLKIYEKNVDEYKDKIVRCFRETAELAPDNALAQCRLGHAYYGEGRLDSALYCFEQAMKYDPNEGFAYYTAAKIHLIRGEDEKCLETLNRLAVINESHPLVYGELAIYHAMHDEIEQCDECFKKAALCGHRELERLERQIDAIKRFRKGETYNGSDLPEDYYRRVEKPEPSTAGKD